MAIIRPTTLEQSDRVRQQNLTDVLGSVSTGQQGTPSDAYISPTGPVQSPVVPPPSPVATVNTAAPEPTIGEQLTGIQNEALRIQDILNQRQAEEQAAAASGNYMSPTMITGPLSIDDWQPDVNEEDVNRATLRMFQKEIDATNQVYDQLLNQERLQGEGRLGSGRAMAARGGLLGSDFAASQKSKIQDFNTEQQRAIQAERQAKIGSIMGTARREAAQKIADKRAARQAGYEAYREFLTSGQDRLMNNVTSVAQAFIAQGIDPMEDEEELATIAAEIGAKPADIITAYQANLSTETGEQFTLSKDQIRFDAEGNIIAEGPSGPRVLKEGDVIVDDEGNVITKIPKTYKPGTGAESGFGGYSNTDEQILLGGGWNQEQIISLSDGVRQYGLSEVIKRERAAGATKEQIKALQSVYGVDEAESGQSITRESLAQIWGLADTGTDTGWWFGEQNDKEAIDALMAEVELYREAGYTDKEILDIML